MNTGVTFIVGDKIFHTFYEFGYKQLAEVNNTLPTAKRHLITDIMGMDSVLDYTEQFGPVRFNNRSLEVKFEGQDMNFTEWAEVVSRTADALHERYAKVILDTDPDYYYYGLCRVTAKKDALAFSEMSVVIDAFPWKRRIDKYVMNLSAGTHEVINDRMPASPEVTVSGYMNIEYDGKIYEFKAGTTKADFEFMEGINQIRITGSGTMKLEWEGGRL